MAGGVTQTCLVHNSVTSGASSSSGIGSISQTKIEMERIPYTRHSNSVTAFFADFHGALLTRPPVGKELDILMKNP